MGLEISLSSLQNTGFGIRDFSCLFRAQDLGFRMRDSLSSIQGTGFGIWDSAYCLFIYLLWTQDLGFKIHINTVGQYTRFGIRDFRSCFFHISLEGQDLGFEESSCHIFLQGTGFGIRDIISLESSTGLGFIDLR